MVIPNRSNISRLRLLAAGPCAHTLGDFQRSVRMRQSGAQIAAVALNTAYPIDRRSSIVLVFQRLPQRQRAIQVVERLLVFAQAAVSSADVVIRPGFGRPAAGPFQE